VVALGAWVGKQSKPDEEAVQQEAPTKPE
jgi:hypothetical protein